jgi:small subunit ribosomal protein S6
MAAAAPTYDLMVLLDTAAPDDQRAKVLADAERIIGNGGEVVNKQDWGPRALAFEIRHKKDAEYHLIQFHATPEVLRTLDRTLHITDGVVRFRIIKLAPGTPPPPAVRPEAPRAAEEPVAPVVEAPDLPEEFVAAPDVDNTTGTEEIESEAPVEAPEPDATVEPEAAPEPAPAGDSTQ